MTLESHSESAWNAAFATSPESAVLNPQGPDPAVLAGVSELCEEIEKQLATVKAALPLEVLNGATREDG